MYSNNINMGKIKEMQIEMDNEPSASEIDRKIVRNMSDDEFNAYRKRHMEEIIGSDYLMCMFNCCGGCTNCAEARALGCYTDTPYVHREDCQCGKNVNKRLVEVHYGREIWEIKSITVCDFCFWKSTVGCPDGVRSHEDAKKWKPWWEL